MGVRNDEELKNLRKIGIAGVRCRENSPSESMLMGRICSVTEPVTLVRNSMSVECLIISAPCVDRLP